MDFVVEASPDFEATARLAQRAFGRTDDALGAARFRWTYEQGFDGALVVAAIKDGEKIGQGAFVFQQVQMAGRPVRAAQFVDLFVDPAHRGGGSVRALYAALLEQAAVAGVELIFATPNPAARELNKRLMDLHDLAEIPFRVGIARPFGIGRPVRSFDAGELSGGILDGISHYCHPSPGTAFTWPPHALARRLNGHPNNRYSIHLTEKTMLVASPRTIRGVPVLLAAGFLVTGGHVCGKSESRALLRAAAAMHGRPLFAYAGVNASLSELPGTVAPRRIKPPVLVQGRTLAGADQSITLERCELLDFDFA